MTFTFSVLVCFLYAVTFFRVWIYKKATSSVGLFLVLMLGIVNVSRYALGFLIPGEDLMQGSWFFWGRVSETAFIHSSLALIVVLVAIFLNDVTFKIDSDISVSLRRLSSVNVHLVSWFLLVAGIVASAYRSFLIRDFINANGYLATFAESADVPFIVNIMIAIPHICFYAFVANNPKRSSFFLFAVFYLLGLLFTIQTGQRTEFMVGVLLVLWSGFYLGHIRGFLKFAPLGVGMVILAIVVNNWRLGQPVADINIFEILMFFWGQGVTILLGYGFFENREYFDVYEGWFFFNKFISCDVLPYLTGTFCVGEAATQVQGIWWQKLSYILDTDMYLSGGGLGGSMVVSLYLLMNSSFLYLNLFFLLVSTFCFLRMSYSIILTRSSVFSRRIFAVFFMHKLIFFPRAGLDVFVPHPREILALSIFFFFLSLVKLLARRQKLIRG